MLTHALRRRRLPLLVAAAVLLVGCAGESGGTGSDSICTLPAYVEQDRLDAAAKESIRIDPAGIESPAVASAARPARDAAAKYLDAPDGTSELLLAAVEFIDALERLEAACVE